MDVKGEKILQQVEKMGLSALERLAVLRVLQNHLEEKEVSVAEVEALCRYARLLYAATPLLDMSKTA